MGTIYSGNPTSTDAYNTAPAPYNTVNIYMPADTDPNNVATMFTQQNERFADNLQYLIDGYTSFNGTTTFTSLYIDGIGGQPIITGPGTLTVSGNSYLTGQTVHTGAVTMNGTPSFTAASYGTFTNLYNGVAAELNGNITAGTPADGASLTLYSTSGFPSSGTVKIDSEHISYTGLTGTTLTNIARGADATTPASHSSGAIITLIFSGGSLLCPSPGLQSVYGACVVNSWCKSDALGNMYAGFGIASISSLGSGAYDVVVINTDDGWTASDTMGRMCCLVTNNSSNNYIARAVQTSASTIRVTIKDTSDAGHNAPFSLAVYLA